MFGEYDPRLVALSVVIAMLASYAAFDVLSRIGPERPGWRSQGWLIAGALALGTGFWATHFVGVLALDLPLELGYDLGNTLACWLIAVVTSGVALATAIHPQNTGRRLVAAAVVMAAGMTGMHYVAVLALQAQHGDAGSGWLGGLAFVIAFAGSAAALRIAAHLHRSRTGTGLLRKISVAVIMAAAIAGSHYTAMLTVTFIPGSDRVIAGQLDSALLATLVGASIVVFLGIALAVSIQDRRRESGTAALVASLSRANAELLHLSRHDPLTGLPNRALLNNRLDKSVERWKIHGAGFAVAYIDLDGFKAINDHLGHRYGDTLLTRIAQRLGQSLKKDDLVARIGGDEFVVLIDSIDCGPAVKRICARLLDAIGEIEYQGGELAASIGYALCPNDGADGEALIAAADIAMYRGKLTGKNRIERYREDMGTRMSDDFALQAELRDAIRGDGLAVYFQPRFRTADCAVVGAEALVRWPHALRGFIPPERFIGVAERCGLITELELSVLDMVGRQIREWLDVGLDVPPISVNLSAVRIRDEALPDHVQACLDKYDLDAGRISFEITESLAVREIVQARSALARFEKMGIQVALDDFGTGYSSLFYLKQLPIQQLKIDRSFIADSAQGAASQTEIVEWIIGLSHELKLKVVAEGVETEQQLRYLQRIGCDEVQGFWLSRPLSSTLFQPLLSCAHPGHDAAAVCH